MGDTLSPADAPRIAKRPLTISAEIEPEAPNGVILAQGGPANGYTLFLQDGKLAFGLRVARKLTVVSATQPLGAGHFKVQAQLADGGQITLSADGKPVASGVAPGLIAAQPGRGLTVGSDPRAIADYTGPNGFRGKIENVNLRFP
jgi:arylsulfatase